MQSGDDSAGTRVSEHAPTAADRSANDRSAASRAYATRATAHIEGGDVVGYGAFLFLSSSTLSDSIDQRRSIEMVHVSITNANDISDMFGDVDDQLAITLETILRTLTRTNDLIGREDRATYSVLIADAPAGTGMLLANRIVQAVESYNEIRNLPWPIDVCCEVLDQVAVLSECDAFDPGI